MRIRAGLLVAFLTIAAPAAVLGVTLSSSILGNGGTRGSNGTFTLNGTVGQPAVGLSSGASFQVCSGFWCFGGTRVLAVDPPGGPDLPKRLEFSPPAPNPARGAVRLVVALPRPARVQLAIYDITGREVLRIADGEVGAGVQSWQWTGTGAAGGRLGAGVFFARLVLDGRLIGERRLVLLR